MEPGCLLACLHGVCCATPRHASRRCSYPHLVGTFTLGRPRWLASGDLPGLLDEHTVLEALAATCPAARLLEWLGVYDELVLRLVVLGGVFEVGGWVGGCTWAAGFLFGTARYGGMRMRGGATTAGCRGGVHACFRFLSIPAEAWPMVVANQVHYLSHGPVPTVWPCLSLPACLGCAATRFLRWTCCCSRPRARSRRRGCRTCATPPGSPRGCRRSRCGGGGSPCLLHPSATGQYKVEGNSLCMAPSCCCPSSRSRKKGGGWGCPVATHCISLCMPRSPRLA